MESQVNLEGRECEVAAGRGDVITGGGLGGNKSSGPVGTGEGTFEKGLKRSELQLSG